MAIAKYRTPEEFSAAAREYVNGRHLVHYDRINEALTMALKPPVGGKLEALIEKLSIDAADLFAEQDLENLGDDQ